MLNETEAAASFHGLCHFFGRLSKASRAGMKAALRGCPKCHFPMLEGLAHTISTHGQNGAVYVSDFAREAHQPLPAISRSLRQLEQDGLGYQQRRGNAEGDNIRQRIEFPPERAVLPAHAGNTAVKQVKQTCRED